MNDNTYKVTELVGTSSEGVTEAIDGAIQRASKTLKNVDWFEVTEIRGHLTEGQVADWQVGIKLGFRLEE